MKRASCGLIYGAMNTTKTTNLGRVAKYLWDKYQLYSRLISADNEYDTLEEGIRAGYIKPFAIAAIPNPFPVMTKLSLGYWPAMQNGQIVMVQTPREEWSKIGAYLIEGTTTIAELLHQDHIRKARKIGEDVVGQFTEEVEVATLLPAPGYGQTLAVTGEIGSVVVTEDKITFAKSAQSHFGHVQDFVTLDLIPRFSMLPLRWVWWTGHEYQGEDEATGQMRLGPGLVGKAATMKVPRKLGNTFHAVPFENIQTNPATHKSTRTIEYRAYFEPHADAYMRAQYWPAGLKMPVAWVSEWRKRFPDGYISLTLEKGIEQFLEFQDEMVAKYGEQEEEAGALAVLPARAATPAPAAPRVLAPVQPIVTGMATNATQTRPPARSSYPARPSRFAPRPAIPGLTATTPQPTLEEQLQKSIDLTKQLVEGPKVSLDTETDMPDINAVPAAPEKEPA